MSVGLSFEEFLKLSPEKRQEWLGFPTREKKYPVRIVENEAEEIQRIERVKEMREDDLWREQQQAQVSDTTEAK